MLAGVLALQVVDTETWQERNAMGFSFDFGGEVTNLNGVLNDAEGDNQPCYDLSGRRTLRPAAGGIYISGRKKILVK